MRSDDGVQRILKTGLTSTGPLSVSVALWTRGGKVFAEARVFYRATFGDVQGLIEAIRVEAPDSALAVALLESRVEERYGRLNPIHWWSTNDAIQVGQRVWVVLPERLDERAEGVVTSVDDQGLLGGPGGFVVLLADRKSVVACSAAGRGTRWDFASD